MEPNKFDFWQGHSLHYLEMAFRNDRRQRVAHPDGYGKRIGECGDTVEMYLSIGNGRIRSVSYETNGCMNTNACANTVADWRITSFNRAAEKITGIKKDE